MAYLTVLMKKIIRSILRKKRKLISDLRNPDGENGEDVYKRAYPVLMHIIEECQANGFERAA